MQTRRAAIAPTVPGSARGLLITILGELVGPSAQPVWTATLLRVLTGLGVEEQTARQAIARAAARGWITAARHGREVRWTLAPKLERIFAAGSPRVYSLSDPWSNWDGSWLMLLTTIPQTHRSTRRPLYAGLTWAGLGNPAPGLWVSPHVERAAEVGDLLDRHDLTAHTFSFVGSVTDIGLTEQDIVDRGWDLAALREHYHQLLASLQTRPRGAEETLLSHVRMISQWQELPRTDPQLPEALLPDWIGRRVARRIESLRAQWTPAVRKHFAALDAEAGR